MSLARLPHRRCTVPGRGQLLIWESTIEVGLQISFTVKSTTGPMLGGRIAGLRGALPQGHREESGVPALAGSQVGYTEVRCGRRPVGERESSRDVRGSRSRASRDRVRLRSLPRLSAVSRGGPSCRARRSLCPPNTGIPVRRMGTAHMAPSANSTLASFPRGERGALRASRASVPGAEPLRREHESERARLVERLVDPGGIMSAYARDLENIRRRAAELRVKNHRMLQQVRALQTKPTSSHSGTRR